MGIWMTSTHGRQTSVAVLPDSYLIGTGDMFLLRLLQSEGAKPDTLRITRRPTGATPQTRLASAEDYASRIPQREIRETVIQRLLDVELDGTEVHFSRIIRDPAGLIWMQRSRRGES